MGTEVHYKNSFPGYYSMRNVNEDSNSSSWHIFYGDNALTNGHYYDGFNEYLGHDKDELKQKMLQHEAVFKNQVYELHRLYRRQRDMMEEVRRKECHKHQISIDTSSSSSLMPAQKPYEDGPTWQIPSFPLGNSTSARPSIFGADISNSPISGSKDCELVECRPSKVRKKLFDLELPAHEYIEPEEREQIVDNQASEISSYTHKETCFLPKNGVKTFLDDSGKKDGYKAIVSGQRFMGSNGLADLNEPAYNQEASVDFFGQSTKPEAVNHLPIDGEANGRDKFSSFLLEPGKLQTPSGTMQRFHGKEVQLRGTYSEISSKIQDRYNQTLLPFGAYSGYPFVNTSNTGSSCSPSSLTRKLTAFQAHPSFLSSPRTHEVFGDRNTGSGGDVLARNRFYHGSSSGSKELSARVPSVGFDHRNCNKTDDRSQKIFKGSNFVDLTDANKGLDLNTVQTLSNEDDNSRKCDQMVLPWLRAKPSEKDDSLGNNKKLLGFRIFGNFCSSKNDASSAVSTSASMEHKGIDINVAWDETDGEIKNFKNHFDLNSCVTEDDDLLVTESVKNSKKKTMEIDLEAPAVSEIEEEAIQCGEEHKEIGNLANIAAEAIVAISSQEDHMGSDKNDDPLLWFVEVIDSCEKNMVRTIREIDEYETLTLQLEETKEEDYMPIQLVSDFQEPDEAGPALRPRRGQARRGRPRRDFQRDILPGMTSLSRHEISEDVQIFGGLMRATGHSWSLGLTRRNGKKVGGRGRRKVKVVETTPIATEPPPPPPPPSPSLSSKQPKNMEVAGLDERSLTGWGKTTRRPRRQRCAAGNSVAVPLT